MTELLRWFPSNRDELPEHAVGLKGRRGQGFLSPQAALAQGAEVAIGYPGAAPIDAGSPAVFVLAERTAADTLAWLSVFAPDAAPLSQFGRVVSENDWIHWQEAQTRGLAHVPTWACVILGEMLAYNAPEAPLQSTPVSRHVACWSNAVARTALIHDSRASLRACTDRLAAIESDARFVRREVSIADLAPIWALAASNEAHGLRTDGSIGTVRGILSALAQHERLDPRGEYIAIDDFPDIFGESIERRVVAFQQLCVRVQHQENGGRLYSRTWHSALVAAAAYLVGRGTSHYFLLRRFRCAAISSVWFGAIAAFQGPTGWDGRWAKLTKGVERQLRTPFSWEDPGTGDIAWLEYAPIASRPGKQDFHDLARLTARTLTIEVVPGANCQMRLADESGKAEPSVPRSADLIASLPAPHPSVPAMQSDRFRDALAQFVELASTVQGLLGEAPRLAPDQGTLALAEPTPLNKGKRKPKPRTRKPKAPPA